MRVFFFFSFAIRLLHEPTLSLSALIQQRRRMVLSRRALSLFSDFRRIYSVVIGIVPINTLKEARFHGEEGVLHFYPVKTNNFITSPSKLDRAALAFAFFTHSPSGICGAAVSIDRVYVYVCVCVVLLRSLKLFRKYIEPFSARTPYVSARDKNRKRGNFIISSAREHFASDQGC